MAELVAAAPETAAVAGEGGSRVTLLGEGSGRDETNEGDGLFMEPPQAVQFSVVVVVGRCLSAVLRWSMERWWIAPDSNIPSS